MKNWYKRFECYQAWDLYKDIEDTYIPWVYLYFDIFTYTPSTFTISDTNHKNRWKVLSIKLCISKWLLQISIPYKKLPDLEYKEPFYWLKERKAKREGNLIG